MLLGAEAFVAPQYSTQGKTSLNLTPDQADQLVAASNAAIYKPHDVDEEEFFAPVDTSVAPERKKETAAAARAFVYKVFSIPSSVIKRHPHPEAEGLEDAVLYPVVGFKFVPVDGEYFALPTTSHAACRILNNKNEELVGWFKAPGC
jgi:hypothetical protein